jgi:hypothetical protein
MNNTKATRILEILLITTLALVARPLWAAFVANPSFENNYTPDFNGQITPDGWTAAGAWGVNQAGDVFYHSGLIIADRDRFAFIWHDGTLSQEISGLTPGKQYWLQFWYAARDCCGGSMVVQVSFGGTPIGVVNNVQTATDAFHFMNMAFTPTSDTGTLAFQTTATGDATALFDAVSIVQRNTDNVVIANPSFEASGPPTDTTGNPPAVHSGEIINPAEMAGWLWDTNQTGSYGISLAGGVYADNGAIPDQDLVGFIAGPGSLSQTVSNFVANTSYQLSFAYNAQAAPGVNAHLQVKVRGTVVHDEIVAPVGGSNPYRTTTVTFTPTDSTAEISFAQTSANGTLLLDDIRLVGQVPLQTPIAFAPTTLLLAGTQVAQVQVTVPAAFLASSAVDVQISSPSPGVVAVVGADQSGVLTLHFAQGATNVQFFEVVGVGRGAAGLTVTATTGLNILAVPTVTVFTAFVLNPSFEYSAPGVTPITAWTGGTGVSDANGPDLDNGVIPDQHQVAVLEGTNTLSQQIYALTPGKNHWLQFRYNASVSAAAAVDLKVKLGGNLLATIPNITAVGSFVGDVPFYFTNLVFVPTNASELLEFSTTPTVPGTTSALLLDAVSMAQRDPGEIVIENPSFEASGKPVGLNGQIEALMDGWTLTGTCGGNSSPLGPIADNGVTPDQSEVVWTFGSGSAANLIDGLTPGQVYTLWYRPNARNGSVALTYDVAFGSIPLLTGGALEPVGDDNSYLTQYLTFTNDAPSNVLTFTSHVTDGSFLLDDIHLRPGVWPAPTLSVSLSAGMVTITWPMSATGFVLQETSALPGGWTNSTATVTVQGPLNVVNITPTGTKFYRLGP